MSKCCKRYHSTSGTFSWLCATNSHGEASCLGLLDQSSHSCSLGGVVTSFKVSKNGGERSNVL
ncbi:hypothetical protein INR49_028851 [Caranx melampygus]|nr:hypothetical protein INR49_028851 [Caranx melampygus]